MYKIGNLPVEVKDGKSVMLVGDNYIIAGRYVSLSFVVVMLFLAW